MGPEMTGPLLFTSRNQHWRGFCHTSRRLTRIAILIFYRCSIRVLDRGAGTVDLVSAALVGETVLF